MRGDAFVEALRKKFRIRTDGELARALGITTEALRSWNKAPSLTPRQVAALVHRLAGRTISGGSLLASVKRKLDAKTDRELASLLGMSTMALHNWKAGKALTERQLANAIAAAKTSSENQLVESAIRPLVEFYPLRKVRSRHGAKFEILPPASSPDGKHPYVAGLRQELGEHHGIYVFFDSRGRAIYAGKARKQTLLRELTHAFNRAREVQRIRTVRHPKGKRQYLTAEEKVRQISPRSVALHDLAAYFSAYVVAEELIDELESLLVRAFANDLSNVKMERFGQQKRTSKQRRHR